VTNGETVGDQEVGVSSWGQEPSARFGKGYAAVGGWAGKRGLGGVSGEENGVDDWVDEEEERYVTRGEAANIVKEDDGCGWFMESFFPGLDHETGVVGERKILTKLTTKMIPCGVDA
jgi:hypothetical protein